MCQHVLVYFRTKRMIPHIYVLPLYIYIYISIFVQVSICTCTVGCDVLGGRMIKQLTGAATNLPKLSFLVTHHLIGSAQWSSQ